MGKSRAQIQREYRERKKNSANATEYMKKEQERAKTNNFKLKFLSNEEKQKRREKLRIKTRVYRQKNKEKELEAMLNGEPLLNEFTCEHCNRSFAREATFKRHKGIVHGPMMSCVRPDCNYTAPQSRPSQLAQHMARIHDIHYYKGGPVTAEKMASSDPEMTEASFDKEKVCAVLRDSVLKLCKENYSCSVEVDGLICISMLNTKEQHVVKIHDLLTEDGQLFTSVNPASKVNVNQKRVLADSTNNQSEPSVHPTMFIQNSNQKSGNQSIKISHPDTRQKAPVSTNSSLPSQANSENSSRFPHLVQTLQERVRMTAGNNRASSASPTFPTGQSITQNRNSLLGQPQTSVMNTDRSASNLLKILSSHNQHLQQKISQESSSIGQSKLNDNYSDRFHLNARSQEKSQPNIDSERQSKQNVESSELVMSIKQEPVDDEIPSEGSNDQNIATYEQEESQNLNIKNEPEWNTSEYGVSINQNQLSQSEEDSSQDFQAEPLEQDSSELTSARKRSILANILNGREESYTKNRETLAGLSSKKGKVNISSSKGEEKGDEQDNSLLYRLPFVTFQDLFPGSPAGDGQTPQSSGKIQKKVTEEKKAITGTKSGKSMNLEVLMRKMLEEKSPDKKKTPQRKRKKPTKNVSDTSDCSDYSEEDFDSPESDKDDDIYVPSKKDLALVIEDPDEKKFSMSLRRKSNKKPKRSVAIKSTSKLPQKLSVTENDDENIDEPASFRYACSHCNMRFPDRSERDRHEENDCINELIICDICKGYFANTSSRNKHLFEVHSILHDEQKEEIKENRRSALEEFRTVTQPEQIQQFEFETLRQSVETEGPTIENLATDGQFAPLAISGSHDTILVTKFIVPFSKENAESFIKCPLCINLFSDLASKDEHLRKKHKIANQIDNGDGTVSLQVLENKPSNVPPVFVKFEKVS